MLLDMDTLNMSKKRILLISLFDILDDIDQTNWVQATWETYQKFGFWVHFDFIFQCKPCFILNILHQTLLTYFLIFMNKNSIMFLAFLTFDLFFRRFDFLFNFLLHFFVLTLTIALASPTAPIAIVLCGKPLRLKTEILQIALYFLILLFVTPTR